MEPLKLTKSFKYENSDAAKGAIFHGALLADQDGLYLVHNKHTWESAAIAVQFGPLGMLIHHLFTKKKTVEYPFPTLPASEVSPDLKATLGLQKFKDSAEVSIIPKDQVQGYTKSTFKGTRLKVGDVEIVLTGALGKAVKQLPDLGYAEL
jgi:hypothetical protein